MAAQGGEQAPVVLEARDDLACEIHEAVLEDADDMEAVSDQARVRQPLPDKRALGAGEVDAGHPHLLPAVEAGQEAAQVRFTAPGHDIEDAVVAKVAKRGGKRHAAMHAVLVDAQQARTLQALALARLARRGEPRVDAPYGG
jgi:hypothetical protein